MTRSVEGIIFDVDGTLLDSLELIHLAYKHIAETVGAPEPDIMRLRWHMAHAHSMQVVMGDFFPGMDFDELIAINGAFMGGRGNQIQPFEGVLELVQSLHGEGYKLGILTGGPQTVHDLLAYHGMHTYFSSVVHSQRTEYHKPHPGGYLLACDEMLLDPSQTVMVGDSINDIRAGINAGARASIGITHGLGTKEELLDAGATHIIDSVSELKIILRAFEA